MKCLRCYRDKLTSTVSMKDDATPWTKDALSEDKHERRHTHDSREFTVSYTCTLGHQWTRRMSHPCWCGWSYYQSENIASIRIFYEIGCWVGEDNFILMGGKSYKGSADVRLERNTTAEADEIVLEEDAAFYQLLRGIVN